MGRLTRRIINSNQADCAYCTNEFTQDGNCRNDCKLRLEQMEKLAACEDAEDQGRLVVKLYIAGKITGDEGYLHKFRSAKTDLEQQGFTVINPAELPMGMRNADYMRICFAMMDSADVVAFLPDYTDSKGAQLEWTWCQYVGKQTMYLESMSFYRNGTARCTRNNPSLCESSKNGVCAYRGDCDYQRRDNHAE